MKNPFVNALEYLCQWPRLMTVVISQLLAGIFAAAIGAFAGHFDKATGMTMFVLIMLAVLHDNIKFLRSTSKGKKKAV